MPVTTYGCGGPSGAEDSGARGGGGGAGEKVDAAVEKTALGRGPTEEKCEVQTNRPKNNAGRVVGHEF